MSGHLSSGGRCGRGGDVGGSGDAGAGRELGEGSGEGVEGAEVGDVGLHVPVRVAAVLAHVHLQPAPVLALRRLLGPMGERMCLG